jgi:hypothetical protein
MGSHKCGVVGKSQPGLIGMIDPIIFTRTRSTRGCVMRGCVPWQCPPFGHAQTVSRAAPALLPRGARQWHTVRQHVEQLQEALLPAPLTRRGCQRSYQSLASSEHGASIRWLVWPPRTHRTRHRRADVVGGGGAACEPELGRVQAQPLVTEDSQHEQRLVAVEPQPPPLTVTEDISLATAATPPLRRGRRRRRLCQQHGRPDAVIMASRGLLGSAGAGRAIRRVPAA